MKRVTLQGCTSVSARVTYSEMPISQFWSRLLSLASITVDFWLDASKASGASYSQKKFNIFFLLP